MNEKISISDRENILKSIAISVLILELFITACVFLYQQDEQRHIETPITDEIAKSYMEHPEKLKPNERIAYNSNSLTEKQKSYFLIIEETIHYSFPWKGWILLSLGAPVALFFLIVLISKAYFQIIEPEENEKEEISNKWINSLNKLSKINIFWLMLIIIGALFILWYVPEVLKLAGNITTTWLSKYWWIPTIFFVIISMIFIFWLLLQYKLKLKAMNMEMEMEKFRFMQIEEKKVILLDKKEDSLKLIEENKIL